MMTALMPGRRPGNPCFSSGPCAKRPGWTPGALADAPVGRSHRSKPGKTKLREVIDRTRVLLAVPDAHRIAIVPASDTGAMEMAMWSLLGARPVTMLAWESFGEGWVTDAVKQLRLDATVVTAPYGELPDLAAVDWDQDVVFTWNGTTSGVRVPSGDVIPAGRAGLTICDATSAAFAQPLPFDKLDVVTFSWQKALGGEAAHGVLILGPRAVERLTTHAPAWPLPKIFRMTKGGKLIEGLFEGETINTPSMLAVEDCLDALRWAEALPDSLAVRSDRNLAVLADWVERTPWIEFLARDPATRSNTSACFTIVDPAVAGAPASEQADFAKALAGRLEAEGVAYDIGAYRDAPPGLRVWAGGTVEAGDLAALTEWLDWAYQATPKPAAAAAAAAAE
ncbi:phosphoserine transaminase [Acuticoccus sp.]|uniref:phosphoserine transaminase n=1 Tax=Acuticoccus sp. TaxID=1904378 RepID=UPI003B515564